MAFAACGAVFLGVVFDGCKYGLHSFSVDGVDVFFALFLDGDEVALEEGFEVVGDHALFLSERYCEFVYAHGFVD